jgi:NAD+ kinase
MTLPIDLVLVRHGQSEGNLAQRLSEAGEDEQYHKAHMERHTRSFRLTECGCEQAIRAGEWLRREFGHFDRYMVSEFIRAMETAALLDLPDAQWFTSFYLAERDWGEYDYYTQQERIELFGKALRMKDIEPFFWRPLNGESLAELGLRLDRNLGTLHRECSRGSVIMVCHGEVMWTYRVLVERMAQQRFKELHLSQDPLDRIYNGQILHYSRRNPYTLEEERYVNWMRMIRPVEEPVWVSEWQRIERPRYSNRELLNVVESYSRVLLR